MRARRVRRRLVAICICAVLGAAAVAAPSASASPSDYVAGKLLAGARSHAVDAVLGNLMAHIGLDPSSAALKEISGQLSALSAQLKQQEAISKETLEAVLHLGFAVTYGELEVTTITRFQEDLACYVDANIPQAKRNACRTRFKKQAPTAQIWRVANKVNDVLTQSSGTILQSYAKSLVGSGAFYTVEEQKKVGELLAFLDDLQVAAMTASIEAESVVAAEEGPQAMAEAKEVALIEAETLEERRAKQATRNPSYPNPGVLDIRQKLWLDNSRPRGYREYGSAAAVPGPWRLPTTTELLGMVKDRGQRTVKSYLIGEAEMGPALTEVPEFAYSGELWTSSTFQGCSWCHQTVSINNAYVRDYTITNQKAHSFLVQPLSPQDKDRYKFL